MGQRRPAVAGAFYPAEPGTLRRAVELCLGEKPGEPSKSLPSTVGLVVPHAGYMYSGPVAGAGFAALGRLGKPEGAVILGTNHTGLGGPLALAEPGAWETPLGAMPVDPQVTQELAVLWRARPSDLPFAREHSVEVQLPFLQVLFGDIPFVPVVVQRLSWGQAERAGAALASVLASRRWVLLASTDFTHYEPDPVAREKDGQALRALLALDGPGFLQVVHQQDISICGVGALALFVAAARALGLRRGQLVMYRTSADAGGPRSEVVGYAAVLFQPERGDA